MINILILEDLPADVLLAETELNKELGACKTLRVQTQKEFLSALKEFAPALIISDYKLTSFNALTALTLLLKHAPEVPFIIFTSSVYEDNAVQCMQAGAWDYVLKEHKKRLGPAVRRALERKDLYLELKSAEQSLCKSELQHRSILNALPNMVTQLDHQCNIIWANAAACTYVQTIANELIGKKCYYALGLSLADCVNCPLQKSFDTGKSQKVIKEFTDNKTWKITTVPLKDEHGNITSIIRIFEDVTEFHQLGKKLQQAQKMEAIGTLAGGIAHDFNNILGAMMGYTELTLAQLDTSSKAYANLQNVMQASKRASNLVRQILTFSRQAEQEKMPLHINAIINEALKLLESTLPANMTITKHIDRDLPKVMADPTQIHQVIMNLCTNAWQAMERDQGLLEIELKQVSLGFDAVSFYPDLKKGEYLQLKVSDTGSGIKPENKDTIFEPYFTTKKRGEGTGLGLAVVHSIVKDMQGQIIVDSEPGQGTTFTILLPTILDKEVQEEEQVHEQIARGKGHILFIDDEIPLLNIGQLMLEKIGYTVQTMTNSLKALELFKSNPQGFDAVITDQTMPGLSGDKLARELLKIRPRLPIILCSGYSKVMSREMARDLGVQDFISKPIMYKKLARVLAKALKKDNNVI